MMMKMQKNKLTYCRYFRDQVLVSYETDHITKGRLNLTDTSRHRDEPPTDSDNGAKCRHNVGFPLGTWR